MPRWPCEAEEAEARPRAALGNQAIRLAELGRPEMALVVGEQAVAIYRELARVRPAAYLLDLAASLHNFAKILSFVNRGAEALAIRKEAEAAVSALQLTRRQESTGDEGNTAS